MQRITMYMKSGNKVTFECESITKKTNGSGDLVGLKWSSGDSNICLFTVKLEQIEAIVIEDI